MLTKPVVDELTGSGVRLADSVAVAEVDVDVPEFDQEAELEMTTLDAGVVTM